MVSRKRVNSRYVNVQSVLNGLLVTYLVYFYVFLLFDHLVSLPSPGRQPVVASSEYEPFF